MGSYNSSMFIQDSDGNPKDWKLNKQLITNGGLNAIYDLEQYHIIKTIIAGSNSVNS